MRKNVTWGIATVAAALIQTTWLDALQVKGVYPDLVLLMVIFFALTEGEERAMFTGVLGGLFQDVASDLVIGHHVLCYVIIAYVTARVSNRLITEHPRRQSRSRHVRRPRQRHPLHFVLSVQDPQTESLHRIISLVVPKPSTRRS